LIERLTCRTDIKATGVFARQPKRPGLRVRVTNTGAKSFVFEAKLNRQTIRRTIGDVRAWSIEQAPHGSKPPARGRWMLAQTPAKLERQQQADKAAVKAAADLPKRDRGRCLAALPARGQAQAQRRMEAPLSCRP
jgi:hypothetical protein